MRGRRVLHLGVVGQTDAKGPDRLVLFRDSFHSRLSEEASEIVGVDIAADIVAGLTEQGVPNLHAANVERLGDSAVTNEEPFDVIVLGDLIEHLSNPGLMLDGLPAFLRARGEIVISSPNAFGLPAFLRFLAGRFREGKDHSLSFSIYTLENLLVRHGWVIRERHTCYQSRSAQIDRSMGFALGAWFLRRYPRFGGTLLVTAQRRS